MIAALETIALLVGTLAVGVVAHELSHVLALWAAGVSWTVEILPDRGDDAEFHGLSNPLARVRPTRLPADLSPSTIRAAALMPLWLSAPLALALVGIVPDPFGADLATQLAFLVWIGCSIPSPQDFSVAWSPRRAIELSAANRQSSDVPSHH